MKRRTIKLILLAVILMGVANLLAIDAGEYEGKVDFVKMFNAGGAFSFMIVGLLVIMLVISGIKFWELNIKEKIDAKGFYLKLKGYIKNNQTEEAARVCAQFKDTTMGFIFWNGLMNFNDAKKAGKRGRELKDAVQRAFDEASLQTIHRLESKLFWLDIIAQVSTLMGLLGTIFGLVSSFDAVANAPDSIKNSLLSDGIAMAMGTTAMGLIVAIPTMFIKGMLNDKAEKIVNNIDEYSVKVINQIDNIIED